MDPATLQRLVSQLPFQTLSDDGLTVITAPCRLSYVHFEKPHARKNADGTPGKKPPRYQCSVLVPAIADWTPLSAAAMKAWTTSAMGAGGAQPGAQGIPFKLQRLAKEKKTGKHYEGYAETGDEIWFRTETKDPVPMFGLDAQPIAVSAATAYSGMWARVKVRAKAYPSIDGGEPGVKFWLQSVQKIADDAPFRTVDPGAGFTALQAPPGTAPAVMPGMSPASPGGNSGIGSNSGMTPGPAAAASVWGR